MTALFLLSPEQMARIEPFFPLSHGVPRVDDRRVVSGIVFVIKNDLRWRDAPPAYGPHKTLYNRFIRWSRLGVFDRIFAALAEESRKSDHLMIDSTHLKAHRTAASLLQKGLFPACSDGQGGLNSKLHAVCDDRGRPLALLLTAGQRSDHPGARFLLDRLPDTKTLIADRGYDSDWFRQALKERGIAPCIPSSRSRKMPIPHDKALYRLRHKIENMFAKLKEWRRVAMRYERCALTFLAAVTIAVIVAFWINES